MSVHVDANVIIDIAMPAQDWVDWSTNALSEHGGEGLVCTSIVYAEASATFSSKPRFDAFLNALRIRHAPPLEEALFLAAKRHVDYRRAGGSRGRILPDFLIGAHAQIDGARLITRDTRFYRAYFPKLDLITP